jgi:DNA modification methylase
MFGWIKGNKPARFANDVPSTQWEADQEILVGEETLHPTPKPTKLFELPMLQHTQVGDICYEPFSGSGSQHVAGEKLGRLVYGMEKEPAYVAGILERLSKMGLAPVLEAAAQPAIS